MRTRFAPKLLALAIAFAANAWAGSLPPDGIVPGLIVPPAENFVNSIDSDLALIYSGLSATCPAPVYSSVIPGNIKLLNERAFPIISGADGTNSHLGAAARLGAGRLAFLGHQSYREILLKTKAVGSGCDTQFMENLFTWLTEGKANGYAASKAAGGRMRLLTKFAAELTFQSSWPVQVVTTSRFDASTLDPAINPMVYVNEQTYADEAAALETYVKNGGSVFIARRLWQLVEYPWSVVANAVAPNKPAFSDYPMIQLMNKAGMDGVYWGNGNAQPVLTGDMVKIQYSPVALDYWMSVQNGSLAVSAIPGLQGSMDSVRLANLENAAGQLFAQNPSHPFVTSLSGSMKSALSSALHGSAKSFTCNTDYKDCRVAQWYYSSLTLAPGQPTDPTADIFPGTVSSSVPRVSGVAITLDASRPGHGYNGASGRWESTGLYAAPGETITLNVASSAADPSLVVRIGAHTDTLYIKDVSRAPRVSLTQALKSGSNQISSPFGGLIYLVPQTEGSLTTNVSISGAVRAPSFRAGRDTDATWVSTIRNYGAPWGEMEGYRAVMTLPASVLRTTSQPTKNVQKWDAMVALYDKFSGKAATYPAPHRSNPWAWRYVPDIQISAGYMHSGYPIMTFLDVPPNWVKDASALPYLGGWGEWHELGHNNQLGEITWSGNGEVTVNLHSLNVQTNNGTPERLVTDKVYNKAWTYLAKSSRDYVAESDVFTKLVFFWQFQLAYKNKAFWPNVSRAYREIAAGTMADSRLKGLPTSTDADKMNTFAIVASVRAGNNLVPHFDAWGVPLTDQTRSTIAGFNLPAPTAAPWKMRADCRSLKTTNPAYDCVIPPGM